MTPRFKPAQLSIFLLPFLSACAAVWCAQAALGPPQQAADLLTYRVYAYRDWQSTDIFLEQGQCAQIKAQGEWLYSPEVGRHGPAGGLIAPGSYPFPYARGGALLGRIGANGEVFYVGKQGGQCAQSAGFLYLRINDDILGDNSGYLSLRIDHEGVAAGAAESRSR